MKNLFITLHEIKKISSFGVIAALVLLAACNPTEPPKPIAVPQNVLAVNDDKDVTVFWDTVNDTAVKGYNVYQDGVKVNTNLVASSVKSAARASNEGRFSFLIRNVASLAHQFMVRSVADSGESAASAETGDTVTRVCSSAGRYTLTGTDMGAYFQNISLTRGATNLTTADVRVNGLRIPFVASANIFQGVIPLTLRVGQHLEVYSDVEGCRIYAYDNIPEMPVITAPAIAASFPINTQVPVAWTSTTNPQRFVVRATWLLNATTGTGYTSSDLPGTSRSFEIPANTLPSDTVVKIRVYAYNDGTEPGHFFGTYTPNSRMAIRNANEAGHDITTTAVIPDSVTKPGVSANDPHLLTLDQVAYEFQAVGEFDLSRSSDSQFRVQARQQPWNTYASVNTAIAMQMNGQKVGLYRNPPVGQSPLRIGDAGVRTVVPAAGLDLGAGFKIVQSGSS